MMRRIGFFTPSDALYVLKRRITRTFCGFVLTENAQLSRIVYE